MKLLGQTILVTVVSVLSPPLCTAFTVAPSRQQQQQQLLPFPTIGISHHPGFLSSNDWKQGSSSTSRTRLYTLSIQERSDAVVENNLDSSNVWELLGTKEGKLALGVKPEEVFKYIGT
jgi:hypothetical protein